jgi:hypothetical protein
MYRSSPALLLGAGVLILAAIVVGTSLFGGSGVGLGPPPGGSVSALASATSGLGSPGLPGSAAPSASPGYGGIAAASAASPAASRITATATATATATPLPTPLPTPRPTAVRTATPRPATPAPVATPGAPCYVFPSSNVWNRDVSGLPVAPNSQAMVDAIGRSNYLHPDFDAVGDGIPFNIVDSNTPTYTVSFQYADESDAGPYPIPASPRIEAGSDRHLLSLDLNQCRLYELYDAVRSGSGWQAGSGAVFDLRSNALRPEGWTSADAAGLPIFPGLVRYDEMLTGSIDHAIRFTAPDTCGYIYPARHLTAAPCSNLPPMGLRVRLKASVDISSFGPHAQIVLTALKRYGMILADNGSPWFISGSPDSRWDDDEMHQLQNLTGVDFEVVDTNS